MGTWRPNLLPNKNEIRRQLTGAFVLWVSVRRQHRTKKLKRYDETRINKNIL